MNNHIYVVVVFSFFLYVLTLRLSIFSFNQIFTFLNKMSFAHIYLLYALKMKQRSLAREKANETSEILAKIGWQFQDDLHFGHVARRRQTEFGKRKNNRSRFCSFFFFISFSLSFSSFWKNKTTRGFSIFHLLLTLFPFFAFFLSSLLFALPLLHKFLIHPFLLLLLFLFL